MPAGRHGPAAPHAHTHARRFTHVHVRTRCLCAGVHGSVHVVSAPHGIRAPGASSPFLVRICAGRPGRLLLHDSITHTDTHTHTPARPDLVPFLTILPGIDSRAALGLGLCDSPTPCGFGCHGHARARQPWLASRTSRGAPHTHTHTHTCLRRGVCLPSREQVPLAVKRTLKPNFILFARGDPVTTLCCLISGSVEVVCVYVEVVCVCVCACVRVFATSPCPALCVCVCLLCASRAVLSVCGGVCVMGLYARACVRARLREG